MPIATFSRQTQAPRKPVAPPFGRSKREIRLRFSPLIERLTGELHHAASNTAITASGINALHGPGSPVRCADLVPYAATDLSLLSALISMVTDTQADDEALTAFEGFLLCLGHGQQTFQTFEDECRILGEARAICLMRRPLSETWGECCRSAVEALREWETLLRSDLPEPYVQNHRVLAGLLNSAAAGFRPCIDSSGTLFMPPLPQRRRWPRLSLLQSCVAAIGDRKFPAFVRDVSAGGLGLDDMPPLAKGTPVSIEMETGRRLDGTIAWSRERSAGLKFLRPLVPADPLIRG